MPDSAGGAAVAGVLVGSVGNGQWSGAVRRKFSGAVESGAYPVISTVFRGSSLDAIGDSAAISRACLLL